MIIFGTTLAILILLIEGAMFLRVLEGVRPLLTWWERFCGGILIVQSLWAFALFLAILAGYPFSVIGFFISHACVFIILSIALFFRIVQKNGRVFAAADFPTMLSVRLPQWLRMLSIALLLLACLKLVAVGSDLLLTPSYFDDDATNWNMRAKVFYEQQSFLLDRDPTDQFFFGGKVKSYPLTVYLAKVWIAQASGEWSDAAARSIHMVWFLAGFGLLWSALRRHVSRFWSFAGLIILLGMPLYILHGTSGYVDVLMASHFFLCLFFLYQWLKASVDDRRAWMLLLAVSCASMVFVKSEGLVLLLPPIAGAVILTLVHERWTLPFLPPRQTFPYGLIIQGSLFLLPLLGIIVPWSVFKVITQLEFGNAHEVSGMLSTLSFQPAAFTALSNALLYTGSFLVFFPAFAFVVVLTHHVWRRSSIGILLLILFLVFGAQIFILTFSSIANEAINQTGSSRGFLQLVPSGVFVLMVLLQSFIKR